MGNRYCQHSTDAECLSGREQKEIQDRIRELKDMHKKAKEVVEIVKEIGESIGMDVSDYDDDWLDDLFDEIKALLRKNRIELCMLRGE